MSFSTKYARPSDDWVNSGTLSVVAGTADSDYPVTELATHDPQEVFKSTGTSVTVRLAYGSSQAPVAVGLFNFREGMTATWAGQSVTIPSRTPAGHCVNAWLLHTPSAAGSHDLALTVPSGVVWLGRLCVLATLRDMRWVWGQAGPLDHEYDIPGHYETTRYGGRVGSPDGYKMERYEGLARREQDRQDLLYLYQDCVGEQRGFFLVPNDSENAPLFMKHDGEPHKAGRRSQSVADTRVRYVEASMGPALP